MTRPGLLRRAALCGVVLLCAGCDTGWPREIGSGRDAMRASGAQPASSLAQAVAVKMACMLNRLDRLHDATAALGQHGGEVGLLDGTALRAQGEYASQLYLDSAMTLISLSAGIDRVLIEMDQKPEAECG